MKFQFGNLMNKKNRGFEIVPLEKSKHTKDVKIPTRSDDRSAGYDFYAPEDIVIPARSKITIWTDICAYMLPDEVLMLYVRSSIGIKKGLVLANGTGIIDSSYYPNNIGICLLNMNDHDVKILKNDRIAQGVFIKYLVADEEVILNKSREGGIGSSGR